MMKAAIAISAILVAVSTIAHAQTVVQNLNLSIAPDSSLPPANYAFTVYQKADRSDWTSVWFKYDGTHLQLINTNLDEGSDWFVVQPGDVFSQPAIAESMFPLLFEVSSYTPIPGPSLTVGTDDFWLGVATGTVLFGQRTAYGWMHLQPSFPGSTSLQMVENVMTYDSLGVVIGTTTALVPEPSTIAMSLCAVVWCLSGRFGRRK